MQVERIFTRSFLKETADLLGPNLQKHIGSLASMIIKRNRFGTLRR